MTDKESEDVIFNWAVVESSYADGSPLLAAVVLGRDPAQRDYCFVSYRQDLQKILKTLMADKLKPSQLVEVVDRLLATASRAKAPVLERHAKAAYR